MTALNSEQKMLVLSGLLIMLGLGFVLTAVVRIETRFASSPSPLLAPTAQLSLLEVWAMAGQSAGEADRILPATFTPRSNQSRLPLPTATASPAPLETIPPTLTPSVTPTSRPQLTATIVFTGLSPYLTRTPPTAIPTAVPTFEIGKNITNILLLGSDKPDPVGGIRTDSLIIVSIDTDRKTAAMLSIPRDMYLFIPGWTMNRINTAYEYGENSNHPGGGIGALKETILYNFGVPIHYYARVDFDGFIQIVDALGGVEIPVACGYTDWRLKDPSLDPEVEDNWEQFVLSAGIHEMDGDLALWYARSRQASSDGDRSRRQQQLLRALLNHAVDFNLVGQAPALWQAWKDTVDTDIDLGKLLQLASIAPAVRKNGVEHLYLVGDMIELWTVPTTGAWVLLPKWEDKMELTFRRLFLPPSLNQATWRPMTVGLIDASGEPDLAALAAANLAWYGFAVTVNEDSLPTQSESQIRYHGPSFKGSYDWLLSWVMGKMKRDITLMPDETALYEYQIVLGSEYDPCRPEMYSPKVYLDQNGD